ncbi:MAG: NCS2 family permease [Solobacterium sp.]|nr:NCS2 family permease [Solobacterium sp.]MBQ1382471.1 NCS2 family permease [Solobacterium sp.]MBQ1446499.1 NCS2 family permease [Solobacterium sp.]MBR2727515.1 NCS2 family permease [Solobacterium sp.]
MFEKLFKLHENGTNVKTEVMAGITTFMTMVYILAVNPNILGASGMDRGAILSATAIASAIACFAMAALSNKPFALSAGLGLNAYFAYTICGSMGYHWQAALTAVLLEGLIFIFMSLTNIRETIFNAIPLTLKTAVSVGIGFFITFIGLQNAHVIVDGSTLVTLYSFSAALKNGTFVTEGITVLLALIGTVITAWLLIRGVKGYMLWGIVITWVLGIICEFTGLYVPVPEAGFYSVIPSAIVSAPASLAPTFFKFDFAFVTEHFGDFALMVFAFLFVDIFDTLGTVIGCASKANMLDEKGHLPGIRGVLMADAIGTTIGACLGTSTITTFVESSSGIAEGGRTGLTTCTVGGLFVVSLFLAPLFLTIPSFATAPALIIVGFLMMQQVKDIDWQNLTEALPSFVTLTMMGFAYSISEGIAFGFISYALLKILGGKAKEVSPLMYVLSVLFLLKYILI